MFINPIFCVAIICLVVLLPILIPYWWYKENKKTKQIEEYIKNGEPVKWKAKINTDPFSMPVSYHVSIDTITENEIGVLHITYHVIEDAFSTQRTISVAEFLERFEPVVDK